MEATYATKVNVVKPGSGGSARITYGNPPWLEDVVARYGLTPPTH